MPFYREPLLKHPLLKEARTDYISHKILCPMQVVSDLLSCPPFGAEAANKSLRLLCTELTLGSLHHLLFRACIV